MVRDHTIACERCGATVLEDRIDRDNGVAACQACGVVFRFCDDAARDRPSGRIELHDDRHPSRSAKHERGRGRHDDHAPAPTSRALTYRGSTPLALGVPIVAMSMFALIIADPLRDMPWPVLAFFIVVGTIVWGGASCMFGAMLGNHTDIRVTPERLVTRQRPLVFIGANDLPLNRVRSIDAVAAELGTASKDAPDGAGFDVVARMTGSDDPVRLVRTRRSHEAMSIAESLREWIPVAAPHAAVDTTYTAHLASSPTPRPVDIAETPADTDAVDPWESLARLVEREQDAEALSADLRDGVLTLGYRFRLGIAGVLWRATIVVGFAWLVAKWCEDGIGNGAWWWWPGAMLLVGLLLSNAYHFLGGLMNRLVIRADERVISVRSRPLPTYHPRVDLSDITDVSLKTTLGSAIVMGKHRQASLAEPGKVLCVAPDQDVGERIAALLDAHVKASDAWRRRLLGGASGTAARQAAAPSKPHEASTDGHDMASRIADGRWSVGLEVEDKEAALVVRNRWWSKPQIVVFVGILVWTGVAVFITGKLLWAADESPAPLRWIALMPGTFVLIGTGVLYWTVAQLVNRTTLTVDATGVAVEAGPIWWPGNRHRLDADWIDALIIEAKSRTTHRGATPETYYELRARLRIKGRTGDPQPVLLPNVRHLEEARELQQRIEARLGLSA